MLEWFKRHIIGMVKRNYRPKYYGAMPNDKQRELARKILLDKQINISYPYNLQIFTEIVAYLLKYTDISFEFSSTYIIEKIVELLDIYPYFGNNCYRIKDQNICFKISDFSKILATSPWIGGNDSDYEKCISFLIEKDVIIHYLVVDKQKQKCKIGFRLNITNLESPLNGVNDYSIIDEQINISTICDEIEKLPENSHICVRMANYHARLLISGNFDIQRLKSIMNTYKNLCFFILVVGKHASSTTKETTSKSSFKYVFKQSIFDVYKKLGSLKDRVVIKSVDDTDEMAYVKGTIILCNNNIKFCSQRFWDYGNERANYGKTLVTHSDNSFSRNYNFLFTKYFNEAYYENRFLLNVGLSIKKSFLWPVIMTCITIWVTNILSMHCDSLYKIFPGIKDYFIPIAIAWITYLLPILYKKIKRKFFIK